MRRAFVVDWDDSLRIKYSALDWVHFIEGRQQFNGEAYSAFTQAVAAYRAKSLPYDEFVQRYAEVYAQGVQGVLHTDLQASATAFVELEQERLASFTLELLRYCDAENIEVIVLSGSPELVLSTFFADHNIKRLSGVKLSIDANGYYTGQLEESRSGGASYKRDYVNALRNDYDFLYGIGDSPSDVEFLKRCDVGFIVGSKVGAWRVRKLERVYHNTKFEHLQRIMEGLTPRLD